MRDHLKTEDYFIDYIERQYKRVDRFATKLKNGEIREERIESIEQEVMRIKFNLLYAKYSIGAPMDEIYNDFLNFLPEFYEKEYGIWSQRYTVVSMAVMLEIPDEEFEKIIKLPKVTDKGYEEDYLMNFMFHYKNPAIEYMNTPILFPKNDKGTIEIIETRPEDRAKYIKGYLEKKWYKAQSDQGWYNSLDNVHNTYKGYWAFGSSQKSGQKEFNTVN